jgi:multiple sugar transport system substrate-binding protein
MFSKYRDDVLAIVKATNGQDLNGDGIPDFGLCAERKNRTDWNPTPYFFWSLAAPYIQSMGTSQGLFFDAETMDIMINTTGFREAAQMYRDLANHGPEENGTTLRSYWQKGRCAIAMDWADIATRSQQNVSIVANVTAMSLPPGTTRVYNRQTKQMEECTSTLCPNMDANGVSRAPFAATLGWTTAVSRFIPESRRQASYSFLSYVSQTNHSIQSVLIGTGWDVVRESQMNPALFLGLGWSNITAQSLALSARGAQNHLNAVVDMPLERWSEYYKIFGTLMSAFLHDEISLDDLQAQLTDAWNTLLDKYGRREQHVAYALSIGAHRPIFDEEVTLPDALRIAFLVISGFCILIALGLIVFVVINREKKVIRGTSPTFHYTTLGGATLIFLSVLLFSIPPPTSDLCVSSMWLFAVS